jgi:hypothetical protein
MRQTQTNIVYGMYSGLALLLDVHQPEQSHGHGVIHVRCAAGYTVFAINHRAAPRHR